MRFVAYSSRPQALVALACALPLFALGVDGFLLDPQAPVALRIAAAIVLAPVGWWMLRHVERVVRNLPIIEFSYDGFLWRGWSQTSIPWHAVERWQAKRHLGSHYLTVWLHEPDRYKSTTFNRVLNPLNQLMGFGSLTFNAGGTDRTFEELAEAFAQSAPAAAEKRR